MTNYSKLISHLFHLIRLLWIVLIPRRPTGEKCAVWVSLMIL